MRCTSCGYDLQNLQNHRCPECGQWFDPRDPSSFLARPVSGRKPFLAAMAAILILALPFAAIWLGRPFASHPGFSSSMILTLLSLFALLVVRECTAPVVRGKVAWVEHRHLAVIAYWMSTGLLAAGLVYAGCSLALSYLRP